jgi:hypothetical protein
LAHMPLMVHPELHFMHDGAPTHFSFIAHRYLNWKFPAWWIGRGGPIAWPPRSPDLSPQDFYLQGHLKSLVYLYSGWCGNSSKLNCGRFSDNTQHARNLGSSSGGNETSSWGLYSGMRWTCGTFTVR